MAIFGCGIVSDESTESYKWMLTSFMQAMHQQRPKSVINDMNNEMREALRVSFPEARQSLCSWYVEKSIHQQARDSTLVSMFEYLMYEEAEAAAELYTPAIFKLTRDEIEMEAFYSIMNGGFVLMNTRSLL